MEKTREQLLHDLAHYQDLRFRVTDDLVRTALDELIRIAEEAIKRTP